MRHSRRNIPHEVLTVHLPTALLDRVRLLHLDPDTGIVRYGMMKQVVTEALTLWLEQHKDLPCPSKASSYSS